jgi:hypothetical protein
MVATVQATPAPRVVSEASLPHWPLVLMISAYPVWFVLGLSGFMWVVLAVPMAAALLRRHELTAPRGFGLWCVFLVAVVASGFAIDSTARLAGYTLRVGYYLAATVFLLYVLNGGRTVTAHRVVRAFTLLWMFTVAGGYLALVLGDFSFRSPMWFLLPSVLLDNELISALVTPGFADVQNIIGIPVPRPKAPFPYTNSWGAMVALTTPFAFISLGDHRVGLSPRLIRMVLAASVVPIVISLNRGLWLSLGIGLAYGAIRSGLGGNVGLVKRSVIAVVVVLILVALSPLGELVSLRIGSGHSDQDRLALISAAVDGAWERPLFGWGAPRPNGNLPSVGTHGQIWLVAFSHGFVGAAGFVAALTTFLLRTRRQPTARGLWAHTVILIALVQLPFYLMIPHSLFAVMAAVAVALRYQTDAPDQVVPRHAL